MCDDVNGILHNAIHFPTWKTDGGGNFYLGSYPLHHIDHICNALQQNREQVAQPYSEIRTVDVDLALP